MARTVATDRAKDHGAFNFGVPLLAPPSGGSSAPSRKKKEGTGGFIQPASRILENFEAVLVVQQARQLVASGKRVA